MPPKKRKLTLTPASTADAPVPAPARAPAPAQLSGSFQLVTAPVYQQVVKILRDELAAKKYAVGDKFPSERHLADFYRISRATANKVVSGLVAEGLLEFRKGIGTFVARQALAASLRSMQSFTATARQSGWKPTTQVLEFEKIAAADLPAPVRADLHLDAHSAAAARESVWFFLRRRTVDGLPVILERRWLRARYAPDLRKKDLAGSFYDLLETRYKLRIAIEHQRITAVPLSAADAALFNLAKNTLCLHVAGPGLLQNGTPIWSQALHYHAAHYQLENTIHLPTPADPAF